MNNIRDNCEQPDAMKVLLFTLATYCDRGGICFPSNRTLAKKVRKSERQLQRMLKTLTARGEVEVLAPGVGRDKPRVLF